MEEQLTEEQIEERVRLWIEKMIKYTQYQFDIGKLPNRLEECFHQGVEKYRKGVIDPLVEHYKKELRMNPHWIPVKRVHYYGLGICWESEGFLEWEK